MQPLYRNDVFQLDDVRYRVVHIDNVCGKLYGFPIDDHKSFPKSWNIRDVILLHTQKLLKLLPLPSNPRPLALSAAAVEAGERRWAEIGGLLENPGELMERATRGRAIAAHAEKTGVSDRHLIALLRKLWRHGLNKSSLQGDFHNCGRFTMETKDAVQIHIKPMTGRELVVLAPASQKPRGRPTSRRDYIPYAYPPGLKQLIVTHVRNLYLKDETVSIRFVQDDVVRKFFALRDENGDVIVDEADNPFTRPLGERASNEQVRYLIKKTIPEHEAYSHRVSAHEFSNNVARSDGTVHDDCVGPGDVYEIDATIVDVIVASKFHGAVPIGKATLYLVVDRDTNLIVGFHLCLNKPSWEGAKRAILSISADWEEVCKSLGVKYREGDWPARNTFPNRFFTDRGEGISEKSNVVVLGPGIEVSTAPRLSPRRKCRVEGNFFYTIGVFLKDFAGAYEPPSKVGKRHAKKYDKDMRYNLDQLATLILKAIIRHNKMVRTKSPIDPKLIYDGFRATPINLWNHRVVNSTGLLSRTGFDEMRHKLLPIDAAKMTQSGIQFRKLYYSFDHQRFGALCALAERGLKIDLVVQYDTKADHIWVSEKSNPAVQYKASLTSKSVRMKGATWVEVLDFQKALEKQEDANDEYNQGLRIGYAESVSKMDAELEKQAKEAKKGVPRATGLRLGVEARELEVREREEAHQANETAATVVVQGLTPLPVDEAVHDDHVIEAEAVEQDYLPQEDAPAAEPARDDPAHFIPEEALDQKGSPELGVASDYQYFLSALNGAVTS